MQFFQHTKARIKQLAFAPNGKILAAIADVSMSVGLCDMVEGIQRTWKPDVGSWVQSIAFAPKGNTVAVGEDYGTVLLYESPHKDTHQVVYETAEDDGMEREIPVCALAFAPPRATTSVLAVASAGIVLIDRRGLIPDEHLNEHHAIYSLLAWAPKGDIIAAYEEEYDQVTLWRLSHSLQPSKALTQYSLPSKCTSLAFSPDSHWLAMAHRKGVFLEDVRKRHSGPYQVLRGHEGPVRQVVFHPDGSRIATSGDDGTVRFWDFATRSETDCFRWDIGQVRALAFSPDGMRCAAGGEKGRIVVWDVG